MSQENLVGLECSVCHRVNYHTNRNQKKIKERLLLTKYCKHCKKHTEHKETKV